MPFDTLRPDLAARLIARLPLTRAITCRRCNARPLKACIIQAGEHAGSEMGFHHIERVADANPDIITSVPDPLDAVALAHYVPPGFPPHFTEARMALSSRIKSVYCPECEAAPGQPCEGRKAFKGTMSMYHLARAAAVIPGLLEAV